jgi:hypothetical protein
MRLMLQLKKDVIDLVMYVREVRVVFRLCYIAVSQFFTFSITSLSCVVLD